MTSLNIVMTSPYLLRQLLLNLNYNDTISFCQINKLSHSIYRDKTFWSEKAVRKLDTNREYFYDTSLSPSQRYLELATKLGLDFSKESRDIMTTYEFIRRSIQFRYELPKDISQDPDNHQWVLRCATEFNDPQLISIYLGKTKDFNEAAYGALRGGHKFLFEKIRLSAPADYPWEYKFLLGSAIESGNKELIEDVRSMFPQNDNFTEFGILSIASVISKDPTIIDYIISNILPPNHIINWRQIGYDAAKWGHKNNLAYILTKYNNWDWNDLAVSSIFENVDPDLNKIQLILASAPKGYKWDYSKLASYSLTIDQLYLFNLFYSMAPIGHKWNLDQIAIEVPYDDIRIVTTVFSTIKRISNSELDWNEILIYAIKSWFVSDLNAIIKAVPENYQCNKQAILNAVATENFPAVYNTKLIERLAPILNR